MHCCCPWYGIWHATVAAFEEPFQPSNFVFPCRRYGTETFNHAFTPAWFNKQKWLRNVAESEWVLCFGCLKAVEKSLSMQTVLGQTIPSWQTVLETSVKSLQNSGNMKDPSCTSIQFKGMLFWWMCLSMPSCLKLLPNSMEPHGMFWNYCLDPLDS